MKFCMEEEEEEYYHHWISTETTELVKVEQKPGLSN